MTETYTMLSGRTLSYDIPRPEVARFLARVVDAAHDPNVTESTLTGLIYGTDNPLLDQTIFKGRGAVTPETVANPVYHVMLDYLDQKRIQAGTLDLAASHDRYTMTVAEAAGQIGMSTGAVRQAILKGRLGAIKKGGQWYLRPAGVKAYQRSNRGPRPRSGKARDDTAQDEKVSNRLGGPLSIRMGNAPGVSFRLKALQKLTDSERTGRIRTGVLHDWKRIAVWAGTGSRSRMYEIAPSEEKNEIIYREFYVRGRFAVLRKLNNVRKVREAWSSFVPQ